MTRPLRAAVVTQPLGVGGGPAVSLDLADALASLGYAVTLVSRSDLDGAGPIVTAAPVRGHCSVSAPSVHSLVSYLSEERFDDVILNNVCTPGTSAQDIVAASKYSTSMMLHGFVPWSMALLPPPGMVPPELAIVAITEKIATGIVAQRPDLANNMAPPLPNCVDVARYAPTTEPQPNRPLTVGYVGRMSREKRLDRLVDVFAAVHRLEPMAKLLVIGGVSHSEPATRVAYQSFWLHHLAQCAANAGIANSLTITGVMPDASKLYADMDVLLLTSSYEGTPLVVLEAMASGVPIVSVDVGNVAEVMGPDSGYVVNCTGDDMSPEHVAFMAELVVDAWHKRAAISGAARSRAVATYSKERYTSSVAEHLGVARRLRSLHMAA